MKIITALIILFSFSPVYAKLYKCQTNGKTSYQQKPCKTEGNEFKLKKDISEEQQKSAAKKLEATLAIKAEKDQLQRDQSDRERIIRAEESNAYSNYQSARQSERQAEALEKRNEIEENKTQRYTPYIHRPLLHRSADHY